MNITPIIETVFALIAAVITAIVDGHDRLLLQHNAAWKDSRL